MVKSSLAAAALAMLAAGAQAQVYVGSTVGWAKIPTECNAGLKCEDGSAGYRVHVGYDDTAKIAGELGYLNFGSSKAEGRVVRAKVKAQAFTLGLAFRGEVAPGLKGVLRVGTAYTTAKITSNVADKDQDSTLNAHLGLGMEYQFAPNLQAIGAFDWTRGSTESGEKGGLYLLSAGVQYHF
ncbi:outer membrane beta-barrel protein [uncultured Aquabacterium sp.]|uniref:outer membrane beta-barrel protein n=1 Tax=Aquabacterium commune TaxID=70586 RepID=UPI001D2B3CE8|nr:outer membrane beta-barrel protein [Aquabacterium sp.]|tara:strand:- start:29 stop:571 length:543 start_codon:yes stop_codon:yes gene_type:complete